MEIGDGGGNEAMRDMFTEGLWHWRGPERLRQTQESPRFYSVLDCIFSAHNLVNWQVDSRILHTDSPIMDDGDRSAHRPAETWVLIRQSLHRSNTHACLSGENSGGFYDMMCGAWRGLATTLGIRYPPAHNSTVTTYWITLFACSARSRVVEMGVSVY